MFHFNNFVIIFDYFSPHIPYHYLVEILLNLASIYIYNSTACHKDVLQIVRQVRKWIFLWAHCLLSKIMFHVAQLINIVFIIYPPLYARRVDKEERATLDQLWIQVVKSCLVLLNTWHRNYKRRDAIHNKGNFNSLSPNSLVKYDLKNILTISQSDW